MRVLGILNDTVRFFLELAIVAVFVWFGWWLGPNALIGLLLAALFGAVACGVWVLVAAPRRRFATPGWVPGAMFLLYGALAVVALGVGGHGRAAALLGVLVVANEGARLAGLEVVNRVDGRG